MYSQVGFRLIKPWVSTRGFFMYIVMYTQARKKKFGGNLAVIKTLLLLLNTCNKNQQP